MVMEAYFMPQDIRQYLRQSDSSKRMANASRRPLRQFRHIGKIVVPPSRFERRNRQRFEVVRSEAGQADCQVLEDDESLPHICVRIELLQLLNGFRVRLLKDPYPFDNHIRIGGWKPDLCNATIRTVIGDQAGVAHLSAVTEDVFRAARRRAPQRFNFARGHPKLDLRNAVLREYFVVSIAIHGTVCCNSRPGPRRGVVVV